MTSQTYLNVSPFTLLEHQGFNVYDSVKTKEASLHWGGGVVFSFCGSLGNKTKTKIKTKAQTNRRFFLFL